MSKATLALLAACAAVLFPGGPALATAGMVCIALDQSDATVEINLPRLAGSRPNWIRVIDGDRGFSTLEPAKDGAVLTIRQFFDDGDLFAIDLADESGGILVARLRMLRVEEGDELSYFGYLQLPGSAVHPMSCTEDE